MKTRQLYIDLLKKSLANIIYLDLEVRIDFIIGTAMSKGRLDLTTLKDVRQSQKTMYDKYVAARSDGKHFKSREWGLYPHTMVGLKRLDNIEMCVNSIVRESIPGDLVEAGVWRGGAAILMRGMLRALEDVDRKVWVCDSFQGLPAPELPQDAGLNFHKMDFLSINVDTVKQNFAAYDLLDEQVEFLKGWFSDTLPTSPIEKIALLRIDGDMYKSTIDVLKSLYNKVSPGGYVIIDDYNDIRACRTAVNDFRKARGIDDHIVEIDWTGVYWRKQS